MENPNIPVHKEPHCLIQKEPGDSSSHFTQSLLHTTHLGLLGPNTAPGKDLETANVNQMLK